MNDARHGPGQIKISVEQIPPIEDPLPVLKLGDSVQAPLEFLEETLRSAAPGAKFAQAEGDVRAAYQGKRLVAFVNTATGDSRIFPLLEGLRPGTDLAALARVAAERIVAMDAVFPADDTRIVIRQPKALVGSRRTVDGERSDADDYLAFVQLRRHVGDLPVFGPGTRASIAVGNDGSLRSFTHRWRTANATDQRISASHPTIIVDEITQQLKAVAQHSQVRVDKVGVAYYDGGQNFLQPVYRFQATVTSFAAESQVADRRIHGYVSIGNAVEALPVYGVLHGGLPTEPVAGPDRKHKAALTASDPTVGRYVVRNDSSDWVNSANGFMRGLTFGTVFSGLSFADSQYFWAEPRLFLAEKNGFINNVQIALAEVHGNWGLFSTRDNHDDIVALHNIPASGYGGASGGTLAYWIIHSCEVIPTQTDESASFDVWWTIFKGLHAVVGYRTEMWINDEVCQPFGVSVGLGAPIVSAWLQEVSTNDSYDDGDTYHDGNRDIDEPMGRASAVAVCGHSDDTAHDLSNLGPATCLTEWWFSN